MSFLENMNNNPEFLNDFLKYSAYITFKSNLTVDEMYLDIRTFFRYLIFSKNENNVEFDKGIGFLPGRCDRTAEDPDAGEGNAGQCRENCEPARESALGGR